MKKSLSITYSAIFICVFVIGSHGNITSTSSISISGIQDDRIVNTNNRSQNNIDNPEFNIRIQKGTSFESVLLDDDGLPITPSAYGRYSSGPYSSREALIYLGVLLGLIVLIYFIVQLCCICPSPEPNSNESCWEYSVKNDPRYRDNCYGSYNGPSEPAYTPSAVVTHPEESQQGVLIPTTEQPLTVNPCPTCGQRMKINKDSIVEKVSEKLTQETNLSFPVTPVTTDV